MAQFSYMGTKRQLASTIAQLARQLQPGPFMDLFSGISAAGIAVGTERPIWCNDVQHFSCALTKALYTSASTYHPTQKITSLVTKAFEAHRARLLGAFSQFHEYESSALSGTVDRQVAIQSEIVSATRGHQAALRGAGLDCLFTTTHAGTYFGFLQSVEIDSIRHAVDQVLGEREINSDVHRWMIVALCQAVASASNSTGHFAQYLTAKPSNIGRVVSKRRRSVWSEWLRYSAELRPLGPRSWRSKNKVFQADANELLDTLGVSAERPGVVYADPPYTDDQYSRFYHVLENVVLYDYPTVTGKGEYRQNRFTSDFSLAGNVTGAFERMVASAAKLGSALMISYPSNGLMKDSTETIMSLLHNSFAVVDEPIVVQHVHSTMGASKGPQKHSVNELIFLARH